MNDPDREALKLAAREPFLPLLEALEGMRVAWEKREAIVRDVTESLRRDERRRP